MSIRLVRTSNLAYIDVERKLLLIKLGVGATLLLTDILLKEESSLSVGAPLGQVRKSVEFYLAILNGKITSLLLGHIIQRLRIAMALETSKEYATKTH
jgi:prepilin signal peptidase PulO-like enzyme (type II secretory pathway)